MNTFEEILIRILAITVAFLISALLIMWLWNWLMPTLFGLTTVTFNEALGLSLLSDMFFRSNIINNKK